MASRTHVLSVGTAPGAMTVAGGLEPVAPRGVGLSSAELADAVFAMVPLVAVTFTVRATVAVAAFASVPRLQVTVVVPEHEPWLGVAETNDTPAGRTSVTTTLVAALGPLLSTEML